MNELIEWSRIDQAITDAKDIATLGKLKREMEAVERLARAYKLGIPTINRAKGYQIKICARAGGEFEALDNKRGMNLPKGNSFTPRRQASNDVGVRPKELYKWAKIWEKIDGDLKPIDLYMARETETLQEISLAGFWRYLFHVKKVEPIELPTDKYSIIYADPPWPISQSEWKEKWQEDIKTEYEIMPVEDIAKLEVKNIVADQAVLFLWTTHTFLPRAFEVIEAWGFKYNGTITWYKHRGWTSQRLHRSTEFCLYCWRGSPLYKGEAVPAFIDEPSTKHSRKPKKMREIIESRFIGKNLELFAREKYKGWDTWGNEV